MIDKAMELELLSIIEQLFNIRMKVKESQGQGFLMNAERNISTFVQFQANVSKNAVVKLIDSKS